MSETTTPQTKQTIQALWRLEKIILDSLDFNEVVQKIVDSVLIELGYLELGYRIIVLGLTDEEKHHLKRISISQTEDAEKALRVTPVPFREIIIPFSANSNVCVRAVLENKPFVTQDWTELLCPPYTKNEAIQVQKAVGIKTSMIFPVNARNKAIGFMIFSMIKDIKDVSEEEMDLIRSFTDVVGLAVQNSTLYSSLGKTTQELKIANDKLEEVDKLKDEFVSLASHELRTPMTIIKSYVWMLLNDSSVQLSEKQKKYLEKTLSSTQRLINLVNDMLNVSRIESGKLTVEPVPTDVCKLVSEVAAEMQARAAEVGVNLSYVQPASPLMANVDIDKIKEVVINLIGNSLKFTPKGGSVTITVDENIKDFALVKVTDTGRGITSSDMPKLFKKFNMVGDGHLTKDQGQGTGLGLYLSKSLVELHGGRIWVESEGEGKGATFSFTLPLGNNSLSQQATQIKTVVGSQDPAGPENSVDSQKQKIDKDLPPVPNPQG